MVDPEVIAERGTGSPARATWLGLAAQAAFARGDRFAVVRYLREASRDAAAFLASASISEIDVSQANARWKQSGGDLTPPIRFDPPLRLEVDASQPPENLAPGASPASDGIDRF